jgi:hypothetical protein
LSKVFKQLTTEFAVEPWKYWWLVIPEFQILCSKFRFQEVGRDGTLTNAGRTMKINHRRIYSLWRWFPYWIIRFAVHLFAAILSNSSFFVSWILGLKSLILLSLECTCKTTVCLWDPRFLSQVHFTFNKVQPDHIAQTKCTPWTCWNRFWTNVELKDRTMETKIQRKSP